MNDETPMLDLSNRSAIERRIAGALKSAIDAHGPIERGNVGSAAKRVYSELKAMRREQAAAGAISAPPKAAASGAPTQDSTDA